MKVLFICTGNTCRSCMAEAIFNYCSEQLHQGLSAGVAVVSGSKTSLNSSAVVMENLKVDISDRKAIQLTEEHIKDSDLILTMTESICDYLKRVYPTYENNIYSLNSFVGIEGEILDPYGGTLSVYKNTFEQLKNSIILLLNKLKEDKGI